MTDVQRIARGEKGNSKGDHAREEQSNPFLDWIQLGVN